MFPRDPDMFEELWTEIADAPGEIYDIPELREDEDFDFNDYIAGDYDY